MELSEETDADERDWHMYVCVCTIHICMYLCMLACMYAYSPTRNGALFALPLAPNV